MPGVEPGFRMIRKCGPFHLMNPAPPRYFSLAVGSFELKREPILTAFNPDFSGQEWTDGKSSGGHNGLTQGKLRSRDLSFNSCRAKGIRAVSSVVERLVYTEGVGGSKPSPPSLRSQRVESVDCCAVALAKADFFYLATSTQRASTRHATWERGILLANFITEA